MEHRALSNLILRIAGLLVVVYSITNAARNFGPFLTLKSMQDISISSMLLSAVVSIAIPVLIGMLLIYFPATITRHILRIGGLEQKVEDVAPLQQVAVGAIALWLMLYSIVDASYFLGKARLYFLFIEDSRGSRGMLPLSPDDFGGLVSCAVQLLIGIALLLGKRAVVGMLARLRE